MMELPWSIEKPPGSVSDLLVCTMSNGKPGLDIASWSDYNGWNISGWDEPYFGNTITAWCLFPDKLTGDTQHISSRPDFDHGIYLADEFSQESGWENQIVIAKFSQFHKKWSFNGWDNKEDWEILGISRVKPYVGALIGETDWYKYWADHVRR